MESKAALKLTLDNHDDGNVIEIYEYMTKVQDLGWNYTHDTYDGIDAKLGFHFLESDGSFKFTFA